MTVHDNDREEARTEAARTPWVDPKERARDEVSAIDYEKEVPNGARAV